MNKKETYQKIARATGIGFGDVVKVMDAYTSLVISELTNGEEVVVHNFGRFFSQTRRGKERVVFDPSRLFTNALNVQ